MNLRGKHILHVEGSAEDAHLLRIALEEEGPSLAWACTAQGAIDYLEAQGKQGRGRKREVPDLIVLALTLPDRNGLHVLGWMNLRPSFCDIPVIVHSGWEHPGASYAALYLGAKAFLPKTHDYLPLIRTMKVLLEPEHLLLQDFDQRPRMPRALQRTRPLTTAVS